MADVLLPAAALGVGALGPAALLPLALAGGYWLAGLRAPASAPAPPPPPPLAFTCACPPEGWPLWGLVLAFLLGGLIVLSWVGCSTVAAGLAWWWRGRPLRWAPEPPAPVARVNRRRLAGHQL